MIVSQNNDNELTIQILGTQSPFCKENSACPSYLIKYKNKNILLDCGSGSHRFFDFNQLEDLHIFISHLHYDHFSDLHNYMYSSYTFKNLNMISKPINIYLPTYPCEIYGQIKNTTLTFSDIYDINEYKKYNIDEIKIDFCKLEHSNFIENYAIRLEINNKIIVYTGDVSFSSKDTLVKFAKNADILICESSLLKEHNFPEICNHLTAYQAGTIALEAKVKKLILTHFFANEDINKYLKEASEVFDHTFIAKEKDIYRI